MITHSKSYSILKNQTQESLDFAVLCCTAVPSLNAYIKAVEKGGKSKLPDVDYFKGEPNLDQLKKYMPKYKQNLGRLIFINAFTYFEDYFKSLIQEILTFHGGKEIFAEKSLKNYHSHLACVEQEDIRISANKLREYPKSKNKQRYIKHTKQITHTDFRFPSELFATFGIMEFGRKADDLKASQIPEIAIYCFGVQLSEDELSSFKDYRELRNAVAHGKTLTIEFKEALKASSFLRDLALKIDSHIVKHFFVIELS